MDPLLSEFLGAIVRWLMTSIMAYLVARHIITADQGATFAADFAHRAIISLPLLVPLAWSLWRKYGARIKFLTALESRSGTSELEVKETINNGKGATL